MKKSFSILLFSLAVIAMVSCGPDPDPDPTPAQLQTQKLTGEYKSASSKTWTVSSVLFDGIEDRTSDWTGFTLTISADPNGVNGYTTTGGVSPGPWPLSGTWSFGGTVDNPNINLVVRDSTPNELDIAVTVNDSQLTMTFTYDDQTHLGGRTEVVNGEYAFTFTSN